MTMPNFLVVGAAKAGTTALYHFLNEHPDIFMSPKKETNFFALEGQDVNYQGPQDNVRFNSVSVTTMGAYHEHFKEVSGEKAIGEVSPLYLYSEDAAARIKHHIPTAKIIVVLRNPVDRAYSNYLHFRREGREPCTRFEEAIYEEPNRQRQHWEWGWHYVNVGFYSGQVQRYLSRFNAKQLKIYLYEELTNDAEAFVKSVCGFLNVSHDFQWDFSQKYNVSGLPKNTFVQTMLTKKTRIKHVLRPFFPARVREQLWRKVQQFNLSKPTIDLSTRRSLVAVYREDILRLQDIIERDLSAWLIE